MIVPVEQRIDARKAVPCVRLSEPLKTFKRVALHRHFGARETRTGSHQVGQVGAGELVTFERGGRADRDRCEQSAQSRTRIPKSFHGRDGAMESSPDAAYTPIFRHFCTARNATLAPIPPS